MGAAAAGAPGNTKSVGAVTVTVTFHSATAQSSLTRMWAAAPRQPGPGTLDTGDWMETTQVKSYNNLAATKSEAPEQGCWRSASHPGYDGTRPGGKRDNLQVASEDCI